MNVEVIGVTQELRIIEKARILNDLILSIIDETMTQVFKEAGIRVIYNFMENKCHLKREDIPERTEAFSTDLKKLLGSGAPVIERMILKNLYSKLKLRFKERKGYKFSDYIRELKESMKDEQGESKIGEGSTFQVRSSIQRETGGEIS